MRLINGDCLEVLKKTKLKLDCIVADPPDNIDLGYDMYDDNLSPDEYNSLLHRWLIGCFHTAPIVWWSFNAKHTVSMGRIADELLKAYPDWTCKPCTQVITFGQQRQTDLTNNHRPLWRFKHKDAPLYPDQIKVPSWREMHGDKRGKKGGKVPGDVFNMSDAQLADQFYRTLSGNTAEWPQLRPLLGRVAEKLSRLEAAELAGSDVFDVPRVTGNSHERRSWMPTQLGQRLYDKCILFSTKPGDTVGDIFAGSGTIFRSAKNTGRDAVGIDIDPEYCKKISEEHHLTIETV